MSARSFRAALVLGLAFFTGSPAHALPPERTFAPDPIELIAGREVPGKPELAIEHQGIEYRFSTPEN